ncbi:hypothetical protein FP2506_07296 [Fulvimarina pelagi HTCC2506]|uniref:Uncharacterized protein n=1 Tax=Fulvimarina pelagi HTCC2506 TaxID=314231 RepID=Q0G6T7_9HYPH|nr:hypothetical protein FP2506_07296 [Fulvimarina pelagi HTCC2506]
MGERSGSNGCDDKVTADSLGASEMNGSQTPGS